MALSRREQLLARALETLNAIAKASGQVGDVQRVESGDAVLLTWSSVGQVGYAGIDRLPDADPRFALFLTKAPYTTLGEVVTASRFAS